MQSAPEPLRPIEELWCIACDRYAHTSVPFPELAEGELGRRPVLDFRVEPSMCEATNSRPSTGYIDCQCTFKFASIQNPAHICFTQTLGNKCRKFCKILDRK